MINHCTTVSQYELLSIATQEAEAILSETDIRDPNNRINDAIRKIMDALPEEIREARTLTKKCKQPSEDAVIRLSGELNISKDILEMVRNRICVALRMELYKDFIQRMLEKMVRFMEEHEPPDVWGMGYVAHIQKWGKDFYDKWTQAIAQVEPEEEFKRLLLNELPEKWTEKFKPKDFCEYKWEEMPYAEIGKVLSGLRRKQSNKTYWGLGSVEGWTGDQGRRTGMSFYNAWIKNMAPTDPVEAFEREILPYIPPATLRELFRHTTYRLVNKKA